MQTMRTKFGHTSMVGSILALQARNRARTSRHEQRTLLMNESVISSSRSRAEQWDRSSVSASVLGSILAPSGQNGTRSSLLLLEADLCMVMQKMMHSHSVVSAVGQDGARTLRLQSKRILTVTSQSPCLFITHPPTLCWF